MRSSMIDRRGALGALSALGLMGALPGLPSAAHAAPGDSVYQLKADLVDQNGAAFDLGSLRGAPVLASMFYTSCDMVCPMIFETIHATLKALPASERAAARVLMVSFDPAHDTVEVLKRTAQSRGCDEHWTLARGDEATVRRVAAALGFQYRRLTNGEFNHSTTIALLDREGRIAARSARLGGADSILVKAMHRSVTAAAA